MKELQLTLRLPLSVFKAIECRLTSSGENSSQPQKLSHVEMAQALAWQRLPSTLARFDELRQLSIRLDHDRVVLWQIIDEHAILSDLKPLNEFPKLNLVIKLPAHYQDDVPNPFFTIERRLRQRYHVRDGRSGKLLVSWRPDFPILIAGQCPCDDFTEAQVDTFERSEWRTGVNMEHEYIHCGV